MARQTAVVVCPGRGTYNKTELGYLKRLHADKAELVDRVDAERARRGQPSIREMDGAASYSLETFSRGDNASALIFACSYADFLSINRERFDVVAVTGNSMGWYTALACGGAVGLDEAIDLVNTMGLYVHEGLTGGQVIYPVTDEDWRPIPGRRELLMDLVDAIRDCGQPLHLSIDLGGLLLFAGSEEAIAALEAKAPTGPGRFPMRLQNHGAFHSPLMAPVSARARATFDPGMFGQPRVPLIDGQGRIWRPQACDAQALFDYTFGTQVVEPYDFAAAIRVSMREFAPDAVIVLGPGDTLGGAVAQSLIAVDWRGLASKADFTALQSQSPFVVALGREDQRSLALALDARREPVQA